MTSRATAWPAPSLRVMLHRGSDRQSGAQFAQAARRHDVVLTSYPLLARDREAGREPQQAVEEPL